MSYYIGIDGGGTKTHGLIAHNNHIIAERKVGPTNYHSIGLEKTSEHFETLLLELVTLAGIELKDVDAICIGGAGIDCEADVTCIETLIRTIGYKSKLSIVNDCEIALVGANSGYNGGLIISGTGSIAMGITSNRDIIRVGGWGHLFDDLGSGYTLGRDAISGLFKSYDGRLPKSTLGQAILNFFSVEDVPDLIPILYGKDIHKSHIAQVAEIVLNHHKETYSEMIIKENIKDLVELVKALQRKINKDEFDLSLSGSLLIKSQVYQNHFKAHMEKELASVKVKLPDHSPVEGALLIAKAL